MVTKSSLEYQYLSLVAYFDRPPKTILRLIEACKVFSLDVLGDVKIKYCKDLLLPDPRYKLTEADEQKWKVWTEQLSADWKLDARCRVPLDYLDATTPKMRGIHSMHRLWQLQYDESMISHVEHGPCLSLHFGLTFLKKEQIAALRNVVHKFMSAVVATACCTYALVDDGDVAETGRGWYYSLVNQSHINLQRQISRHVWTRSGPDRCYKARGVYWGNLLGPQMVSELGDVEKFVAEYAEMDNPRDNDLIQQYEDGSMLVLISADPADVYRPYVRMGWPMLDRAAWLYRRLAAARLLCGM